MTECDVYNIQCYPNVFVYTGFDFKNNKTNNFVISEFSNDLIGFLNYLKKLKCQIGFNSIDNEYPIIHYLLTMENVFLKTSSGFITNKLYSYKKNINSKEYSPVFPGDRFIRQIDLSKIWHFGNNKKKTSLIDLKIVLRKKSCSEFLFKDTHILNSDYIIDLVDYNSSNVEVIYDLYRITIGKTENPLFKNKNKLKLRLQATEKCDIDCINSSNVRVGQNILLSFYSKLINEPYNKVRKITGSKTDTLSLAECVPSFVDLKTKEMNYILDKFRNAVINKKSKFSKSIYFKNITLNYGLGGVRGCTNPGIYRSNCDYIIIDEDVTSFFPSMAVGLGIYPKHLGEKFLTVYKAILNRRVEEKKKENGNQNLIEMFKYGCNSIIGKSNEEGSVFYDPSFYHSVTIAGQLLMSMWIEKLVESIPNIKILQVNTDGISYIINKEDINKVDKIRLEISKIGKVEIIYDIYDKLIIKDINNYIAIYHDHSEDNLHYKTRGCFEIHKELHLDPSMPIVAKSLIEYFVNGISIEETINNCNDIFDFCIRVRATKKHKIEQIGFDSNGIYNIGLQYSNRVYVSKYGSFICRKERESNNTDSVIPNRYVTIFNDAVLTESIKSYNIDYDYYIAEAMKIKNIIETNQLFLF